MIIYFYAKAVLLINGHTFRRDERFTEGMAHTQCIPKRVLLFAAACIPDYTFSQCHQQGRSTRVTDATRHEAKLFQTLATANLRQCRGSDVTKRTSRYRQTPAVPVVHKSGHRFSKFSGFVRVVSVADHNSGSRGCCRRVIAIDSTLIQRRRGK